MTKSEPKFGTEHILANFEAEPTRWISEETMRDNEVRRRCSPKVELLVELKSPWPV